MPRNKDYTGAHINWSRVRRKDGFDIPSAFEGRLGGHERAARKRKPDSLSIPPWMAKGDYFTPLSPVPDDFGEPEIMTPDQWASSMRTPDFEPKTPDEKMAWKLLYINMSECLCGKSKNRLIAIDEIENWMTAKKRVKKEIVPFDYDYTFALWCEYLNVDEDYMREGMARFLSTAKSYAINNEQPKQLRNLLKLVGSYRPRRGVTNARTSRVERNVSQRRGVLDSSLSADTGASRKRRDRPEAESGGGRPHSAGTVDERADTRSVYSDILAGV
jgi:hypothetical protein